MVTKIYSLWDTILATSKQIWVYFYETVPIGKANVTILSILIGSGLIIALGWCLYKFVF